ncbi:MAG: S-adenosylmethionine:tRNA ribosyltransferase-isomerase [Chitinophagaceae bacterium]
MHPKNLSISEFTYPLPEGRIADYPLAERDASKLLIYKAGNISEDIYKNIAEHIPADALLLFNDTKVIEARLLFQKSTGGIIQIFCLEPHEQYTDITTAMLQQGKVYWQCLVGGASKWKHGQVLKKIIPALEKEIILEAVYTEKKAGSFVIELSWTPEQMSFAELLHHAGAIPLPPYIKRKAETSDTQRYQTIYANLDGSVAAPTAGLHFTNSIFKSLEKKNIQTAFVTLHVGAGTFKPVKAETMEQHEMHSEFIDVSKKTIEHIISKLDNVVIAVGTTSMRTIESLYWLGVKMSTVNWQLPIDNKREAIELNQWEAYDIFVQDMPAKEALQFLLDWMKANKLERLVTKTSIIIAPGYNPRIVKALITNFHQPQSTLLLLIAALIGDDWRKVYDHALKNDFRFLSYGDGCLLWQNQSNIEH